MNKSNEQSNKTQLNALPVKDKFRVRKASFGDYALYNVETEEVMGYYYIEELALETAEKLNNGSRNNK